MKKSQGSERSRYWFARSRWRVQNTKSSRKASVWLTCVNGFAA